MCYISLNLSGSTPQDDAAPSEREEPRDELTVIPEEIPLPPGSRERLASDEKPSSNRRKRDSLTYGC